MSMQSEIDRIKANLAESYAAVAERGGAVPEAQTSRNLPDAIRGIPGGKPYGYLYGFDINNADSNPDTRVSYPDDVDNAGFTPAKMDFAGGAFSYGGWPGTPGKGFMPRPCMLTYAGTVDHYLDPNDYTKRADGAASSAADVSFGGNAMMEWPKIFTKRWESDGVYHFRCSDVRVDEDYECWCNYDRLNNEIPHFYTPIYFGSKDSSNRLRSISGQSNLVSETVANEVSFAGANGDDWYVEVAADWFLLQDLLIMMFRSTNLQEALGHGRCKASDGSAVGPGTMNDKGLFWGSGDQTSGVKAFGMENRWGNLYRRIAGFVGSGGKPMVKITRGTKDGTGATEYNADGAGYMTFSDIGYGASAGYISSMSAKSFGRLAISLKGSASTYEADRLSSAYGTAAACVGGSYTSGSYCGPFFVMFFQTSSASQYIGAAPSCKPLASIQGRG